MSAMASPKKDRRPRKGDAVRIKWAAHIPPEQRGLRGVVVENLGRGEDKRYYVDHESIEEGDTYWGPFSANDLVVL